MFNNYCKKKQPLCGVRSLVCFSFTVLLLYFFSKQGEPKEVHCHGKNYSSMQSANVFYCTEYINFFCCTCLHVMCIQCKEKHIYNEDTAYHNIIV